MFRKVLISITQAIISTTWSGNKRYTVFSAHVPINEDNKKNPGRVEEFWSQLNEEMFTIPDNNVRILTGDFNAQIGKVSEFKKISGDYRPQKTNRKVERLIDVCQSFNMKIMSTEFTKTPNQMKIWGPPNQFWESSKPTM